jgi:hypothetical protein
MPLYIVELAEPLISTNGSGVQSAGIFNRLTGQAYALDASAHSLLRVIHDEEIELEDLDASPARDLLLYLEREKLIASSREPILRTASGVPQALRDFRLHQPLRNPALAVVDPSGRARIIRTNDIATCRLPRTGWRPEICIDMLDDCAIALLELSATRPQWRQTEDILLRRGSSAGEIAQALRFLTDPERQLVRLIAPDADADAANAFFQFPCQNFDRSLAPVIPASVHYRVLDRAQDNFDWLETTVSHAFRAPTAALGDRPFGACIADHYLKWLKIRAAIAPLNILEIGGGLGHFSKAFVQRLSDACGFASIARYTILDRSPALQASQRALIGSDPRFHLAQGDAQKSLPGGPYDFIIANEVIADLAITRQLGGVIQQTGAEGFLSCIAQALSGGGRAYISEYGDATAQPERVEHLEHAEYSIEFGSLREKAQSAGLEASLADLAEVLSPASSAALLIGQQERYLCLKALLRECGANLEFRIYDRAEFDWSFTPFLGSTRILSPLFAPQFQELHYGPTISQFKVLELTAPSLAGAAT